MTPKPPLAAKIEMERKIQGKDVEYMAAKIAKGQTCYYSRMKDPLSFTLREFLEICKVLKMNPMHIFAEYVVGKPWEKVVKEGR